MPATKRNFDFSGVKDGGNFNPKRVPAGDYKAKVIKVEDGKSNAGNDQWIFTIVVDGVSDRYTYPYYCGHEEKQLWKVRNLFLAAGFQVPKKRVAVDPNKVVGKYIGVEMEDDEYEGREKSNVVNVFPVSDLPETKPAAKRPASKAAAKKAAPEPDDEDDTDEDEDVSDDDMDELDLEEI